MRLNHNRLEFSLTRNEYCCGIWEVGNFTQNGVNTYHSKSKSFLFNDLHSVFKDFEERLKSKLQDNLEVDADQIDNYFLLIATLVASPYISNEPQFPEFADYLLNSGWKVDKEFINANTGNTVRLYSRMVTPREMGISVLDYGDEEPDF